MVSKKKFDDLRQLKKELQKFDLRKKGIISLHRFIVENSSLVEGNDLNFRSSLHKSHAVFLFEYERDAILRRELKPIKLNDLDFYKKHLQNYKNTKSWLEQVAFPVCDLDKRKRRNIGNRRVITGFSKASKARMVFALRNAGVIWKSFITLTYPDSFSSDGVRIKKDLDNFLGAFRDRLYGHDYFWFMEYQQRGAPHFHLWSTAVTSDFDDAGLRSYWHNIAGKHDPGHWKFGFKVQPWEFAGNESQYAEKYADKESQKSVPSSIKCPGRFWGHSKSIFKAKRLLLNVEGLYHKLRELLVSVYDLSKKALPFDLVTVNIKKVTFDAFLPALYHDGFCNSLGKRDYVEESFQSMCRNSVLFDLNKKYPGLVDELKSSESDAFLLGMLARLKNPDNFSTRSVNADFSPSFGTKSLLKQDPSILEPWDITLASGGCFDLDVNREFTENDLSMITLEQCHKFVKRVWESGIRSKYRCDDLTVVK